MHILAMDTLEKWEATESEKPWSVEAGNTNCATLESCKKKIVVNLPNAKIEAVGRDVSVNGKPVAPEDAYIDKGQLDKKGI